MEGEEKGKEEKARRRRRRRRRVLDQGGKEERDIREVSSPRILSTKEPRGQRGRRRKQ